MSVDEVFGYGEATLARVAPDDGTNYGDVEVDVAEPAAPPMNTPDYDFVVAKRGDPFAQPAQPVQEGTAEEPAAGLDDKDQPDKDQPDKDEPEPEDQPEAEVEVEDAE